MHLSQTEKVMASLSRLESFCWPGALCHATTICVYAVCCKVAVGTYMHLKTGKGIACSVSASLALEACVKDLDCH